MSTKRRVRLVVAYDGTDFCGWAPQAGQRTVQRTLTEGIRQVSGEDCEVVGASRTDGGAHACGQVCHFDTNVPIEPRKWPRVLNKVLPADLSVLRADAVPAAFHSRFYAKDRWYRYRIMTGARDPMRSRYAWFFGRGLDVAAMQEAASRLVGEHDFLAFSQMLEPGQNSVRTVFSVDVRQVHDEVRVDVVGTAFVRGMMRRIAGALVETGKGKRTSASIDGLLAQRDRGAVKWPLLLPAHGLTLMRVRYGRSLTDNRKFLTDEQDD